MGSGGTSRPGVSGHPGPPQRGWRVASLLAVVAIVSTSCASERNAPSMLRDSGTGALDVERLWWLLFGFSAAVLAVTMGMALVGVLRRNRPMKDPEQEPRWANRYLLGVGVVIPAIILAIAFVASLHVTELLSSGSRSAQLTISVTGHQWWWEARYPNGAVTANEIHIPTGERVDVNLTTADVIHSFWVPQLQGKTDQIPGRVNQTWLETDTPGRYRGECLQFCGLQHANMVFYIVAEPPSQFDAWEALQVQPAAAPTTIQEAAGAGVFLTQSCAGCHTVRGTTAAGQVGPDLTHVASRQTIGAGVLANTPANLRQWILDVQHVKPGAEMPNNDLSQSDLANLVAYLDSLH